MLADNFYANKDCVIQFKMGSELGNFPLCPWKSPFEFRDTRNFR